jgi:hypothetical protein
VETADLVTVVETSDVGVLRGCLAMASSLLGHVSNYPLVAIGCSLSSYVTRLLFVLLFFNRERRVRRQIFIHLIGNVQHELQIPVNKDVGI